MNINTIYAMLNVCPKVSAPVAAAAAAADITMILLEEQYYTITAADVYCIINK